MGKFNGISHSIRIVFLEKGYGKFNGISHAIRIGFLEKGQGKV